MSKRKNVSVGHGLATMPLKLVRLTWASAGLLAHSARIILGEKLGYNVEFAPPVSTSRKAFYQCADCNSTDGICFPGL